MISFLSPLFLAGAAAAAIPIVLHLLKRDPEMRVRFSAVKLLRQAPVEHASHRHLRELLLLALRVAALLLLAFAFARPFFAGASARASSGMTIIALDTSLSMTAPGQFQKAQGLARAAIDQAPSGEPVGVVTFAKAANVAAPPSNDRGAARAAIDGAAPGFEATSYRAALTAAADAMRGRAGRIVVVTDLLENGWDAGEQAVVPESVQIDVVDVGAPPPNIAVTAARLNGNRVLATIRNSGPQSRDAHVRLMTAPGSAQEKVAADTRIPVAANQTAEVAFPRPQGTAASVVVDDPDGIERDNVRYLTLEDAGHPAVLVVGSTADLAHESFYLQQAVVAAGADGRAYDAEPAAASDLGSWDQARMDRHTAVILTSTKGLERRGRELLGGFVRGGGGLLVTAGPNIDGDVVADTLGSPRVTIVTPSASDRDMQVRSLAPEDVRHPIFRMFGPRLSSLGLVQFHRVAAIRAAECPTLARFTTGEPALVDCTPGGGRVLVLASDLDNRWNDFPLHASFVPFVHEAVRYLAGSHPQTSEYLVGSAPAGLPATSGVFPLASGGATRLVAVNVDPAETGAARLTPAEFQTAVTRLQDPARTDERVEAREQEERQHIWQYVLAVMAAMLIVESLVAMRTA